MPLMSQRAYARMKKVSHVTVQDYVAKGQIPPECFRLDEISGKMLLDSKLADAALIRNLDHAKRMGARTQGRMQKALEQKPQVVNIASPPGVSTSKEEPLPDIPAETSPTPFDLDIERFQKSKADTETLKAKKLEIEIAEREGRLLDADEVRKRITKLVGETKEKLLNIPSKIAPELVSMEDVIEIENKLKKEINEVLENLSRLK